MTAIKSVTGRRIWDSRGNPTVEVDVHLENGKIGRGIAPAGASRGTREGLICVMERTPSKVKGCNKHWIR